MSDKKIIYSNSPQLIKEIRDGIKDISVIINNQKDEIEVRQARKALKKCT